MFGKTLLAFSVIAAIGAGSAALAADGRDGDNNPVPGYGAMQMPAIGVGVFASTNGVAPRPTVGGDNWDRCVQSSRLNCVH